MKNILPILEDPRVSPNQNDKKVSLKVSIHHYRNLNMSFHNDSVPITMFFSECSRDQLIIQRLFDENAELKKDLKDRQSASQIVHPQFLQAMISQSIMNSSGRKLSYSDAMKDVALYIFILAGPLAYKTLQKNLPLPSIATIKRKLGKENPVQEGEVRVEMAKEMMISRNEPLFVWIAEDDSKVTSELKYNGNDDTVIGLELPMGNDGLPVQSFFKFTTISAVQRYIEKYPMSSYVKLITCKSLKVGSHTFPLIIYGTHGSDTAEHVILRWKRIYEILTNAGIHVMGFSSDGFSAFLRAMKHFSGFGPSTGDCPAEFQWFFCANWSQQFICIQDGTHMVVKGHRALMTKELQIGTGLASRSVLIAMTKELPRMIIGISENQLTANKDAMNYEIAEKMCASLVTDRLLRVEEQATKTFLELNRHLIRAYIDPTTSPSDRLFSAWYSAFLCRLWKECLKSSNKKQHTDELKAGIGKNFISSNLHGCIEINGHGLLMLLVRCRDMNIPELFQPINTGSQPCESSFRKYRSMSTTRCTVVNFNISELMYKTKRLQALETISMTTKDFTFIGKSQQETFMPRSLLGNAEVDVIVRSGYKGAVKRMAQFS